MNTKSNPEMSVVRGRQGLTVYQMKVTLNDSRPLIWRRIQVLNTITLFDLHKIVQIAMGWTNGHLHAFIIDDVYYSIPSDDDWQPVVDEREILLRDVAGKEGDELEYTYDFGDGWDHTITIEKILTPEPDVQYPRCLAGERTCPPEDVGGVWGYIEFLESMNDPDHPEHDENVAWIGGVFDPDAFDLHATNDMLADIDAYLIDWNED